MGRVSVEQDDPAVKEFRHARYANVGGYIVHRRHALIAAWDGKEGAPKRPSGTAEQVRFKLTGQASPLYLWTDEEPLGLRGERGLVLSIH